MSYIKLRDWFLYSDRDKPDYNPAKDTTITIERFCRTKKGKFNSVDWRQEEWLLRSALVPVNKLHDAALKITSPHDIRFEIGWGFQDQFSFGEYVNYGDIQIYPLTLLLKHPTTQELSIELNHKFCTYHALLKQNQSKYYHPIDNILVAETTIESHDIFDPTAKVIIHRDYLRDFLAALKMGLIISIAADRFANAPTIEELELNQIEDTYIAEFTWLLTSIHTPMDTNHEYFHGRSTLRRNIIIEPYDIPKFDRSPWYYFGERKIDESGLPTFIVDNEGKRKTLPQNTYLGDYISNGIGNYGYLYFRPEVLQKYFQTPGYCVFFHMRNWGTVSLPGDRDTIDVGINSQGLINAFAPDIANLNTSEQAYWASFSSLPSGEVCEEMFQTRMQNNPPNSPGIIELIRNSRLNLEEVFKKQHQVNLFNSLEPEKQDLYRLSVGPLGNQFNDVFNLAKILYEWIIETMQIDSLHTCLSNLGGTINKDLRQIKLLESILKAKGMDVANARQITAPLVGLNQLRIGSAHIGALEMEPSFQLMGVQITPQTPREGWNLCVDAVVASLNSISSLLNAEFNNVQ
jgi:hypothetical protein